MQADVSRVYAASPAVLYKLCSTPAFFRRTGAVVRTGFMDFKVGGRYRYELAEGGNVWGEFRKIVPEREIVLSWSCDDLTGPCKDTTVTITFEPRGGETLMAIKHSGFVDAKAHKSHQGGWEEIFERIGSDFNALLSLDLKFKFSQRYKRPARDIFRAFQRAETITQFFVAETTGPLVEGALVQWKFASHPTKKYTIHVQEVVDDKRIVFQWMDAKVVMDFDDLPGGESRWTIACSGWEATQEGLDDSYSECEGWREVMGSLQEWLSTQ